MHIIRTLACTSLLAFVAACAPAGYYDSNGEYRSYGASDSFRYEHPLAGTPTPTPAGSEEEIIYTRPGYYDYNGYYIAQDTGPRVPEVFFPPHGMCRVWFTDRVASEEPPVESCAGIRSRVPEGAYVIYGG